MDSMLMAAPGGAATEEGISDARRKKILKRISTARLVVNCYVRFFAHLVGKTTTVIAEPWMGVPTAAVSPDGYMFFNPEYVEGLTDPELAGVIIHETMHVALLCWKRQGNRKEMIELPDGQVISAWNLAHDFSFNPEIISLAHDCRSKGKIKLPKYAALDPDYEGLSAEVIYRKIMEKALPPKKKKAGNGQRIGGRLSEMPKGTKPGEGIGDDLRDDLAQTETGKQAAAGCKASKSALATKWQIGVIAAAMAHEKKHGRGSLPAGLAKLINELLESKVDWREVLSQWLGENGNRQDITNRRPRRRFDPNILYLPSFQKFGVDDVVVLWDTSGSMNGRETAILSEIQTICEDLGLRLCIICIDSVVHSVTRDVEEAADMIGQIKGGGGSNFIPAFDLLEEEYFEGVVVAFTDGHIGVPGCKPPLIRDVLWCIKPTEEGGWGDVDPTERAGGEQWGQVLLMEDQR